MNWEVEFTAEFGKWYGDLEEATQDRIIAAVQVLGDRGPGLGRPLVDSVKGSAFPVKELRVGTIRIPKADRVYAKHLKTIGRK